MEKLRQLATAVVSTCRVCQAVKPRRGRGPGTLDYFPIPPDIFQSLCIDFLELPKSGGCDYVMIIVCRLSGYIVAIPFTKEGLDSKETARLFL